MSASVITESESTAGRPRSRSTVSTVSIPTPVKRGVRRTSSQATIARLRLRPVRRLRSVADGTQPARRARSGLRFAAVAARRSAIAIGPGAGNSIARGVELTTIRTVRPCRRALT